VRKGKPPLPERGAKAAARTAKAVSKSDSHLPVPNGIARTVAKKAAKSVMRKTAEMGANAVRRAADRAAVAGRSAVEAGTNRLVPIQLSIDVAVPIHVAWEEWRSYGCLPEGVHRIVDVERDGDSLIGHTAGPHEVDWEAEIKDEREDESFAWRSVEGTDVAGLATFHQLSESRRGSDKPVGGHDAGAARGPSPGRGGPPALQGARRVHQSGRLRGRPPFRQRQRQRHRQGQRSQGKTISSQ
jgi:uncharacterized membrane protein